MISQSVRRHRNPAGRVLHALSVIAEAVPRDWGVRELAHLLGIPPSAAHRVLRAIEAAGLIEGDDLTGRYHPSLEFYRIAWRAAANVPISHAALPVMQKLVSMCNETALLGLYDPARAEMMVVASVDSSHPLRYVVKLHEWVPVYAGASGLGIMAFLSAAERRSIIRRTRLRPFTANTITDAQRLERELETIRRRGYAFTRGQRIHGAVGLAAPVFGAAGHVIGNLILTVPEQRFHARAEPQLARLLIEHAGLVTSRAGGQSPSIEGRARKADGKVGGGDQEPP